MNDLDIKIPKKLPNPKKSSNVPICKDNQMIQNDLTENPSQQIIYEKIQLTEWNNSEPPEVAETLNVEAHQKLELLIPSNSLVLECW
jgi:hypothetical protein